MQYQQLIPSFGGLVVQELPQHLRRGVRLADLVSNFGRLLRTRPDSLSVAEQERLYEHSVWTASLAFFISHSWSSPGHEKYIALLLHHWGPASVLAGVVSSSVVLIMQRWWASLPCFDVADKGLGINLCYSPWEFAAGVAVAWAVLVFGPKCARARPGFFDAACIPQAPVDAKLEAIRHVPSFVAASEEFVLAWDPLYFTRGWCVYELAVYKASFPDRRITVLPVKMYAVMLACQMCGALVGALVLMLMPISDDVSLANGLGNFLIGVIAAHAGEELDVQRRVCDKQLLDFDFRDAGIQIESDRVEMVNSIRLLWEGGVEEFNRRVRLEIRGEVLASFTSCRAMLPYTFIVIAGYPTFPFAATFVTTVSKLPAPVQVANMIFAVGWPFLFFPLVMALAMWLGAKCGSGVGATAGPVPWRLRHLGIGVVFSVACTLYVLAGVVVPSRIASGRFFVAATPWCGPLASLVIFAATAATAAFVFCPRQSRTIAAGGSKAPDPGLQAGGRRTGARIVMAI